MVKLKLRYAMLVTGLLVAAPAEAATYLITYEGTVGYGEDTSGAFGLAGQSLAGLRYTSVFTLTAPLPGVETYNDGKAAYIRGGTIDGTPSPISSTITINGVTQAISGASRGTVTQEDGCCDDGSDAIHHSAVDQGFSNQGRWVNFHHMWLHSYFNDFISTTDYTAPLSYTVRPGDHASGTFQISEIANNTVVRRAEGGLGITSVTIRSASDVSGAVPEPSTWAMMLLGFGFVGGAMRSAKRRQKLTLSYA